MKFYIIVMSSIFLITMVIMLLAMIRTSIKYNNKYINRRHNVRITDDCKMTPQEEVKRANDHDMYGENG